MLYFKKFYIIQRGTLLKGDESIGDVAQSLKPELNILYQGRFSFKQSGKFIKIVLLSTISSAVVIILLSRRYLRA